MLMRVPLKEQIKLADEAYEIDCIERCTAARGLAIAIVVGLIFWAIVGLVMFHG